MYLSICVSNSFISFFLFLSSSIFIFIFILFSFSFSSKFSLFCSFWSLLLSTFSFSTSILSPSPFNSFNFFSKFSISDDKVLKFSILFNSFILFSVSNNDSSKPFLVKDNEFIFSYSLLILSLTKIVSKHNPIIIFNKYIFVFLSNFFILSSYSSFSKIILLFSNFSLFLTLFTFCTTL